jgi:prostaglandin-endoperoxide synthase 2
MPGWLEDFALKAVAFFIGKARVSDLLINKIVQSGRNRPHPWSTKHDYISWSGLTDRSYSARLLPAMPLPEEEKLGTRRPPLDQTAQLFAAPKSGQRPCRKSTLLFPAFAQYLTDGFLRTQVSNVAPFDSLAEDRRRTTSNHDIDMSPLYGRTPAQTSVLRRMREDAGQKGKLKSQWINKEEFPEFLFDPSTHKVKDEFCDAAGRPILDFPLGINNLQPGSDRFNHIFAVGGDRVNATPYVAMMNTLWLREHNRIAGLLELAYPDWDDERVFETARNNIIVMFIKLVVEEYINHISTAVIPFSANPTVCWNAGWNRTNWMTTEFSLLYRWHSLIPQTLNWGGKRIDGSALSLNNTLLIERGLVGSFIDVSGNHATALGLQNSADFLVRADSHAIAQGRYNNVATYNDYRQAMKLKPLRDFKELVGTSKRKDEQERRDALAAEMERLYGDIDNVEFFTGLFAEAPGANGPLPRLVMVMVAMDAFSQALTNPLLSQHVYGDDATSRVAFSLEGLAIIAQTNSLRDILARNGAGLDDAFVGMTRQDWARNQS